MNDIHYLKAALALSRQGLGLTSPNPSVGCVLVKNGCVVGTGRTANGGRPHAERIALAQAGEKAKGATAYVTLEPCAHHGHTSPCCDALIEAGISRLVCAVQDPDIRVAGLGFEKLKQAGIQVEMLLLKEAVDVLNGHFMGVLKNRPFITLKLALSKDGFIAPLSRTRTQISGEMASRYVHLLRAQSDAILVGHGTLKADNPALTCRINGLEHRSPLQVILGDGIDTPTRFFRSSIPHLLHELYEKGLTRLLVEGGAKTAENFLQENLVDELILIRSKHIDLQQGLSVLIDYSHFTLDQSIDLGADIATIYAIKR